MNINTRNIKQDLEKIKKFSELLEKRLAKFDKKDKQKIEKLSLEELKDLNQLMQYAYFILAKYENKKEVHSLLKEFVVMIEHSTSSIDLLNDEVNELIISAENAIKRIKNLQSDVSNNLSLTKAKSMDSQASSTPNSNPSTNNLTKSTTAVYT